LIAIVRGIFRTVFTQLTLFS